MRRKISSPVDADKLADYGSRLSIDKENTDHAITNADP